MATRLGTNTQNPDENYLYPENPEDLNQPLTPSQGSPVPETSRTLDPTAPPPQERPTPPAAPPAPPAYTPPKGGYYGMAGWDPAKLNDPTITSDKYVFGRGLEDLNLQGKLTPDDLANKIVPYMQTHGFPKASAKGDMLDLGTGDQYANVDVIGDSGGANTPWYGVAGGPEGPASGPAGSAGPGGPGGASGADLSALLSYFGGPGGPGVMDDSAVQQIGEDPFSQLLTGKLGQIILNNGELGPNTEALNLENARSVADRARKAEYSGAMSQLANRGLLPEGAPGGQGGLALDALSNIERNDIAPQFSHSVRDYLIHNADNAQNNLQFALHEGTQRQSALSDIALRTLEQNRLFNQFLAQFGLDRAKTLYDLMNGQNTQLLTLFQQFLVAAGNAQKGYV